jgi:hypothetical protein
MGRKITKRRHQASTWLSALAAITIAASGCSASDDDTGQGEEGAGASAAEPASDVLAAATFDGEATTVSGEVFDLAGLANKDLVIWFWAPW